MVSTSIVGGWVGVTVRGVSLLTAKPARDERHVIPMLEKVVVADITADDLPIADVLDPVVAVAAERLAGVAVPLDDDLMAQAGPGRPERQSARTGE